MSLLHYFLSPSGRISRQAFWLGLIVLMALTIPVSLLIDPSSLERGAQPNKVPQLADTLWSLAISWPSAAISIKRFNDRDRPQWIGYLLGVLMALLVIANAFGVLLDPDTMELPEKIAFSALLAFFMWSLVDNGCYKGTGGPNRYGPDPLQTPVAVQSE